MSETRSKHLDGQRDTSRGLRRMGLHAVITSNGVIPTQPIDDPKPHPPAPIDPPPSRPTDPPPPNPIDPPIPVPTDPPGPAPTDPPTPIPTDLLAA